MPNLHIRTNRILLAVIAGACAAGGLMVFADLMSSPRQTPLLMSVLRPSVNEPATAPAPHLIAPAIFDDEADASDAAAQDEVVETNEATVVGHWFNGRPVRAARTVSMLVTAYSPDERSCGSQADGITASGYSVWTNGMRLVAADTKVLPFGSLVSVPGYGDDAGEIVPVLDRGGKIKGNRLDVLYPTHEIATRWGAQRLEVTVWEYADGKPNDFHTQHR